MEEMYTLVTERWAVANDEDLKCPVQKAPLSHQKKDSEGQGGFHSLIYKKRTQRKVGYKKGREVAINCRSK